MKLWDLYDIQNQCIEHLDYDTPTHGTNEALGDIFRELTERSSPAGDYLTEKIDRLRHKKQQWEKSIEDWPPSPRKYLRREMASPKTREKHDKFVERNLQVRKLTERANIPKEFEDRRKLLLELLDAQRDVIACSQEEIPAKDCANRLSSLISRTEQFIEYHDL